ncbi:MAG: 8-amino-7-oxononanoate synthase [Gammaproteobacteria bacterium]|nr:MAG: 8-amino-7-oxononanoate synthase [Gammaproteobacteria bacterium]
MILDNLAEQLVQRKANHLYRSRKVLGSPQSVDPIIDGKKVLSFCSNDYLGLANHPDVVKSFKQAADKYGVGSGSAHLVSGHSAEHHALEEELADFMGTERALLFSTGYMANLGVVSALCDRHSEIYEDKLNHASLLDAALLSRAKRIRYPHLNTSNFEQRLTESTADNKFIISDGVFSMDGDLAPLNKLVNLANENNATLMIDDAHGIGVLGSKGKGIVEHFALASEQMPVLVGTLGKAFGTAGAFVAGSNALIETLIQQSRSYIFTTAMPAAVAAATRKSLQLLEQENWRRENLQNLIKQFRRGAAELGLNLIDSVTAIQPIIIGESEKVLSLSEKLLEKNILISAIRPPTVPEGTSRLRVTFSATHTEKHVDKLLAVLNEVTIK